MIKRYLILALLLCCCLEEPSIKKSTAHEDSARIDTAYIDPISGHIKPPCSLSPNYCGCMEHLGLFNGPDNFCTSVPF
jgi:hypothetical protein